MADPVNPAHYKGDYVMRVIEDFGLDFCLGNAAKYILRAATKGSESTDLRKAIWYIERRISNIRQKENDGEIQKETSSD